MLQMRQTQRLGEEQAAKWGRVEKFQFFVRLEDGVIVAPVVDATLDSGLQLATTDANGMESNPTIVQ